MPRAGPRIKFGNLVGEESELPRVGRVSRLGNDGAPWPSSIRVWVPNPTSCTCFLIFYAELIWKKCRDFFCKKMT
jgi:hypothetical protein